MEVVQIAQISGLFREAGLVVQSCCRQYFSGISISLVIGAIGKAPKVPRGPALRAESTRSREERIMSEKADRSLEVGIIGAGWWAAQTYIPLLRGYPEVGEIAVCRPDPEGLQILAEKLGTNLGFRDAAEMLDTRRLDGVIISSPHVLHAEHALMCIDRGLPVMIEKPMATSAEDARRILTAAERQGTDVMTAYGWNFRPLAAAAHKLMQDGRIGRLQHAVCLTASGTVELFSGELPPRTAGHLFRPPASTWADPARAGGYAWGQLTHALGLFFLVVDDDPTGVFARMRNSDAGVDLCDAAVVELAGGATVSVSGTGVIPRERKKQVDIRLYGDEGVLLLDLERERLEVTRFDGWTHVEQPAPDAGEYGVTELVARFVDLCAGREVINLADAKVGARAVIAIDAMHRSARSGQFEPA
ncbi:Gfo/Idh/MocA family protein [Frigidibacter sp. ROC022]|uniref:Gfo/Idh/MocA family protein n=1 Tax=Frigidibacter sp. ROC022 TaxID=2971796 RepID=UPI00215A102C|nr:Gfo/Idh/MocA family oxidoreductase [Frigidibacter sp. ROC022]MCR8724672.1 Gfo/Idh/MocA family oxidoreductase [Frigidibacter sp. ROC022]